MIRTLLLGKNGQLGWELHRTLAPLGQLVALDYPEIDLSQPSQLRQVVQQHHPNLIVNATAYTDVDRAESEPKAAFAVNAQAPGLLAEIALSLDATLIHYSTDYIFDGAKGSAYVEGDPPNPLNAYGQSKLAGEQAIISVGGTYLILRTSWVYSLRRDNFVLKVLKWSRQQPTLRIVSDQISNPTWARMLAEITAQLLAACGGKRTPAMRSREDKEHPEEFVADCIREQIHQHRGIYHLAGSGWASRLEWAEAILRHDPRCQEQIVQEMLPARTSEFPTPAQRPLVSALDCKLFTGTFQLALPDWRESLQLALSE